MDGEVKKTEEKMSRRWERLLKTQQGQMKLQAFQWGNHWAAAKYKGKAANKNKHLLDLLTCSEPPQTFKPVVMQSFQRIQKNSTYAIIRGDVVAKCY